MTNAISLAAVLLAVAAVGRAANTPEEFMDAVLKDLRNGRSIYKFDPAEAEPFDFNFTENGELTTVRFRSGIFVGLKQLHRLGPCTYERVDSRMKLGCTVSMRHVWVSMNGEIQEGDSPFTDQFFLESQLLGNTTARIEIDEKLARRAHLKSFTPGSFSLHTTVRNGNVPDHRSDSEFMRMVNSAIADQLAGYLERCYKLILMCTVAEHVLPPFPRLA